MGTHASPGWSRLQLPFQATYAAASPGLFHSGRVRRSGQSNLCGNDPVIKLFGRLVAACSLRFCRCWRMAGLPHESNCCDRRGITGDSLFLNLYTFPGYSCSGDRCWHRGRRDCASIRRIRNVRAEWQQPRALGHSRRCASAVANPLTVDRPGLGPRQCAVPRRAEAME